MDRILLQAYTFIEESGFKTLPIMSDDVFAIAKSRKWYVGSYSKTINLRKELCSHGVNTEKYVRTKDAFTVIYNNEYLIFYRDDLDTDYKIFVIIHEFAHIVLRHTYHGILGKSPDDKKANIQESEADIFAREICAPLPVLRRCRVRSEKDIEQLGLLKGRYAKEQFLLLNGTKNDYKNINIEKKISKTFKSFIYNVNRFHIRSTMQRHSLIAAISLIICILAVPPFIKGEHMPGQPNESMSAETVYADTKYETVYVTRTGKKYHIESCRYISGKDDLFDMPISTAATRGYEPCSVCIHLHR